MKLLKKIAICFTAALLLTSSAFATACGGTSGGEENNLRITFYEGGFGRKWLETLASDFIEKKNAEGVTIKITLDGQGADIDENVNTYLSSGRNLSDIYMVRTKADWASDVTSGYLANLNSVYETEVEKLDGSKIKVKDFMLDEIANMPYMQKVPEQGSSYPWIMPWSVLETSIIYNEDLLKATVRSSTGGKWETAPKTMIELAELCDDINKTSDAKGYGNTQPIAPFSWSMGGVNYFQNIIFALWAQQQGVESSNIAGEGSYYDFWNFDSPDVWKQTGITIAIDEWKKIIVGDDGNWKNSLLSNTFQESAYAFCGQNAVMYLGGSFFENEMSGALDKNGDGKADFSYKMMTVPLSENGIEKDGHGAVVNYCSTDDMMFVPAKAANVELAKEFLAFMCNEKYLLDFTKETGCLRPFKYDPVKLTEGDENVKWSDFFYSCYDMMKSDYNIFNYPKTASEQNKVSLIYIYYRPQLFQGLGIATVCGDYLLTKTGKEIMTGKGGVFSYAEKFWNECKLKLEY